MSKQISCRELSKDQVLRLRLIAAMEGTSLILLVMVGIPLKHILGVPAFSSFIGPIHGSLFLIYMWSVFYFAGLMDWPMRRTVPLALLGIVPFGTFMAWRILGRRGGQP